MDGMIGNAGSASNTTPLSGGTNLGGSSGGESGAPAGGSNGPAHGEPGAAAFAAQKGQATQPAQKPQSAPKAQQPQPSKLPQTPDGKQELYEVSVNGKSVKMTLQEALLHAQKSYAADQKFNEAAQMRRQIEEVNSLLKNDPIGAMKKAGFSDQQIQEKLEEYYYKSVIEPEQLTPEQRKLKEYETKVQQYEQAEKQRMEQQQHLDRQAQSTKHMQMYSDQIVNAMEGSNLPKMPYFAQQMAFYMHQNLQNGYEAPMELIAKQVQSDFQSMCQGFGQTATAEQIIEAFGQELIQKIRAHDLKQFREKRSLPKQTQISEPAPKLEDKRAQYDAMLKKLRGL